ncbi:MAG: VanZ family protein [Bryobacteraceae bacterium]
MRLVNLSSNTGRINAWLLAVLGWTGLIFFSSTSLASEWCEEAFSFIAGILFRGLQSSDSSYGIIHLLADKGVHVVLFLVLATLLWNMLSSARWKTPAILLIGAFVGSCSEFLQRFFPGRDPAIRDVLINIAGTAVGIAVSLGVTRKGRVRHSDPRPEPEMEASPRLVD